MIQIKSELGEKEVRAFSKHQFKNTFIFSLSFTVLFILLGALEIALYPNTFYGFFFLIFGIIYSPVIYLIYRIELKKNLNSIKDNGLVVMNLQFGNDVLIDDSFKEDKLIGHVEISYKNMKKIEKDNSAIYVYLNRIQAYVIMKTCFESEAKAEEFYMFMKGKLDAINLEKKVNKK